jgi:uncharacterized protein (TIGR02118 family)
MTIKLMILLDRKAGMSDDEFKKRYEEGHAPLAKQMFPTLKAYRRNFVREVQVGEQPPFDVITEMVFESRAAYNEAMKILADPVKAKRIADDELELFDRSTFRAFLVEECASELELE